MKSEDTSVEGYCVGRNSYRGAQFFVVCLLVLFFFSGRLVPTKGLPLFLRGNGLLLSTYLHLVMFCHMEIKNVIKKVKIALVFGPGPPRNQPRRRSPRHPCVRWLATDQYDTAPNLNLVATMSDEQQEEV